MKTLEQLNKEITELLNKKAKEITNLQNLAAKARTEEEQHKAAALAAADALDVERSLKESGEAAAKEAAARIYEERLAALEDNPYVDEEKYKELDAAIRVAALAASYPLKAKTVAAAADLKPLVDAYADSIKLANQLLNSVFNGLRGGIDSHSDYAVPYDDGSAAYLAAVKLIGTRQMEESLDAAKEAKRGK